MGTRIAAPGVLALLPALSIGLAGCGLQSLVGLGSSSGGGSGIFVSDVTVLEHEVNDDPAFSTPLLPGHPVRGDLLEVGDVDWFNAKVIRGATVHIELWATRLDQASWDASGTAPVLTVYFPTTEDKLLEQGFRAGWTFGALDFDVPVYRLPTSGPFLWIKVEPDTVGLAGGRYVLRLSYLSFGPGQEESEDPAEIGGNDTTGTAQAVGPGVVNGFHRDGNDDFYSVIVGGPSVLRFEIQAARAGSPTGEITPYDPLLRLYDRDGTTVLTQNDDAYLLDPAIQLEVPTAGRYTVQVTQSPTSTVSSPYRLVVGTSPATGTPETEPNDGFASANPFGYGENVSGTIGPGEDDWFRFTGTAGDMVRLQVFDKNNAVAASEAVTVTLVGSDGATPLPSHEGPLFQVLTTILQQSGTTYVHVQPDPAALGPTTYRLELRRFQGAIYETEPNDTLAQAHAFPGTFVAGAIQAPGDVDTYRFTAVSHQLVVFDVFAGNVATGTDQFAEYSGYGSALAPLLTIRDLNGNVLAQSTSLPANGVYTESVSDGLPSAAIAFVAPPTTHVFTVEIASADGTSGADHTYVIQRR